MEWEKIGRPSKTFSKRDSISEFENLRKNQKGIARFDGGDKKTVTKDLSNGVFMITFLYYIFRTGPCFKMTRCTLNKMPKTAYKCDLFFTLIKILFVEYKTSKVQLQNSIFLERDQNDLAYHRNGRASLDLFYYCTSSSNNAPLFSK